MNDAQLDKLSKLLPIWETCAKMGGTPLLTPIQQVVSEDLQALLMEIEEQRKRDNPVRAKTPHEVKTSGNAIPTTQPLPEGVDEKGRPLRPEGGEHPEEQPKDATAQAKEDAAMKADYERRMRESRERALREGGAPERRV